MKIALVHDWLLRLGGAERVLIAFHKIFPSAPIYTLFYDQKFVEQYLPGAKVIPSFLQRVSGIKKFHPWFKILMPSAIEALNISPPAGGFDVVISSSHEIGHGVLLKPGTKHICYYHSPSRLLWDRAHDYVGDFRKRGRGGFKLFLIRMGQHFLRLWDWQAGQRPDICVANSRHVAERIRKYYGREAKVIYPPVSRAIRKRPVREKPLGYSHFGNARPHTELANFKTPVYQNKPSLLVRLATKFFPSIRLGSRGSSMAIPCGLFVQNYFLIVSQLYPHKNIDLAVEAFKNLPGMNLVIIGEGPEYKSLKFKIENLKLKNIKLLGFVSDEELPFYYQNCLAYLILNEEDFGISPIEAMSFGKPVLAFRAGGAKETVLEGITGEFFDRSEPAELTRAIKSINQKVKSGYYGVTVIKKHSEKFGFERFKKEILDLVNNLG